MGLTAHLPLTTPLTPPLLTKKKPPNHTLSNTELLTITPELTSTPKKPLTVKPSLDLTKLPFPTVESKPLLIPLITTTVMSLMSNTKVPQSTPNTNPNPTTLPPNPLMPPPTLKLFETSQNESKSVELV